MLEGEGGIVVAVEEGEASKDDLVFLMVEWMIVEFVR